MAIVSVRQAGLGGFTKNRRLSYTFPSTMGMVLLSPTSIDFSGTSASIGANGQVTFTAVTSLSLNGVFSATYDNYVLAIDRESGTGLDISVRLRASGTDASGTNYARQLLEADSTSVGAGRSTSQTSTRIAYADTAQRAAAWFYIYGPFLAQPTAARSVVVSAFGSAYIGDHASTHSLSTSYDGLTILSGGTLTGKLTVMGVRS